MSGDLAAAHGFALLAPAPDGVDAAIASVMQRHRAELERALAGFGLELDDLCQPTWMRIVRVGDVEAFTPAAPADQERATLPLLDHGEGCIPETCAGACCGPGEACSSAACTGTPRD